jgi:hypothetical protein
MKRPLMCAVLLMVSWSVASTLKAETKATNQPSANGASQRWQYGYLASDGFHCGSGLISSAGHDFGGQKLEAAPYPSPSVFPGSARLRLH